MQMKEMGMCTLGCNGMDEGDGTVKSMKESGLCDRRHNYS